MSSYFATLERRDDFMRFDEDNEGGTKSSHRRRLDEIAISNSTLAKKRDLNVQKVEHERSIRAAERSNMSALHHNRCLAVKDQLGDFADAASSATPVPIEDLQPIHYMERLREEEERRKRLASADGGILSLYGAEAPTEHSDLALHRTRFHMDRAHSYSSALGAIHKAATEEEAASRNAKSANLMQRLTAQPQNPQAPRLQSGLRGPATEMYDGKSTHPIDVYHAIVRADLMKRPSM